MSTPTKATASILNVIRVALDRADMRHRETGFKGCEVAEAKAWVSAMLNDKPNEPARNTTQEAS